MLTINYEDDCYGLELAEFGDTLPYGARIVLRENDIPCGVAVFRIANNAIYLDRVAIAEPMRGRHVGDFFIRSLLFKFSFYHIDIIVGWNHSYFNKLGFVSYSKQQMIALGGEVVFPSTCGGSNH